MTYRRFALMIATSTVVMFVLMYLNTYALEHVFFSETRAYMAILMGGTMAVVMMGFMFTMYPVRHVNIAVLAAGVVVFALSLWLVRSQATVDGTSYMRAMIPHHSIAVLTSTRAHIEDPRVAALADDIVSAQNREIAQMRYLIAEIEAGRTVEDIYRAPAATVGIVDDALSRVDIASLAPAPLERGEAEDVLGAGALCRFQRTRSADPILWWNTDGAVTKLNGVILPLQPETEDGDGVAFAAPGMEMRVRDIDGWRSDAALEFSLQQEPRSGYHGFRACD